jgi:hypothetical protein
VIVQTPAGTGGAKTPGTNSETHQLVVQPPVQKRTTSGHHANLAAEYNLEFIEPGIQNHKVEVYRSTDVQETAYNDKIPQDHADSHKVRSDGRLSCEAFTQATSANLRGSGGRAGSARLR